MLFGISSGKFLKYLGDCLTCPAKFMKCFVYILKSQKVKYYIGITELYSQERLVRHNNGDMRLTKFRCPLILVYIEEHDNMLSAR